MDAALGLLLALPATGPLVFVVSDGLCRVPVTDALVPPVEELVVRDVVLLDVLLDLVKCPIGHRIDLDKPGLVDFDDIKFTSFATLAAAATGEDGMDVEFAVGTLGGLDLGHPVVQGLVSFPETGAVHLGKLLLVVGTGGLEDVDVVQGVVLSSSLDQIHRLGKVVQSVEEDHIDYLWPRNIQLGEHVQRHQTCETKGGGLEEMRE